MLVLGEGRRNKLVVVESGRGFDERNSRFVGSDEYYLRFFF